MRAARKPREGDTDLQSCSKSASGRSTFLASTSDFLWAMISVRMSNIAAIKSFVHSGSERVNSINRSNFCFALPSAMTCRARATPSARSGDISPT